MTSNTKQKMLGFSFIQA